jgi:hypothetical protein
MSEELELDKAPVNPKKATAEQLKKTPLNSTNADTITKKLLTMAKKFKITIPSTEKDKSAVFVGVNGVAYNIPRDTEVIVPEPVLLVLKNSVTTNYRLVDEKGAESQKVVAENVARFPFQSEAAEETK